MKKIAEGAEESWTMRKLKNFVRSFKAFDYACYVIAVTF